jgi:hypothetical protein
MHRQQKTSDRSPSGTADDRLLATDAAGYASRFGLA